MDHCPDFGIIGNREVLTSMESSDDPNWFIKLVDKIKEFFIGLYDQIKDMIAQIKRSINNVKEMAKSYKRYQGRISELKASKVTVNTRLYTNSDASIISILNDYSKNVSNLLGKVRELEKLVSGHPDYSVTDIQFKVDSVIRLLQHVDLTGVRSKVKQDTMKEFQVYDYVVNIVGIQSGGIDELLSLLSNTVDNMTVVGKSLKTRIKDIDKVLKSKDSELPQETKRAVSLALDALKKTSGGIIRSSTYIAVLEVSLGTTVVKNVRKALAQQ